MKRFGHILILTLAVLVALNSQGLALVDVAGVLEAGNTTVQIDSIIWYLVTSPFPVLESTPGWEAVAGSLDTFQFQQKSEWPQWCRLFYRLNGIPSQFTIDPLVVDTWYELPSYNFQNPKVRFEDTVLVGIAQPESPLRPHRITITPNPATGGFLLINAPAPANGSFRLEIYDLAGNLVYEKHWQTVAHSPLRVDISLLSPGVYLTRVITPDSRKTGQLIILR
ncbi:MAG: T9SS type A sorting domain-containing protein [candidate division WOR-3 bacterium]